MIFTLIFVIVMVTVIDVTADIITTVAGVGTVFI